MKLEYDPQIDAAYISLADEIGSGAAATTVPVDPEEIDGEINLDFDRDGRLIGIEIQSASRFLPPSLLASAGS